MRDVAIIGAGMVPFGKYQEKTLADIAWPAVKQAVVASLCMPGVAPISGADGSSVPFA